MPGRSAVGDDRAASNERLQAGHAAGGVDDRVGGRQQLAHLLGEAENANARLAREQEGQPCPQRLVSGRQADDHRPRQPQAGPGRALEIADAPAATGDDDDRPLERQPERASRLHPGARREERGRDQRPHPTRAPRSGDPLDRRQARLVHDEVEVDARMRPELHSGKIGRRRTGRHRQTAAPPQIAEHARRSRIGRDDDVWPIPLDQPQQRAGAK